MIYNQENNPHYKQEKCQTCSENERRHINDQRLHQPNRHQQQPYGYGYPSSRPFFQPPSGQSESTGNPNRPPMTPPPQFTPSLEQTPSLFAIDAGAIRSCLFKFTYVWLTSRRSFWFYPTFVGRKSVSGFRWHRWRWVYFGISLDEIQSFQCF